MDFRDWITVCLLVGVIATATVYLFMHPLAGVFGTWAMLVGGLYSTAHALFIWDTKKPDALPHVPE